jgi:EAL and modified HD-GYP domain-containing signal transduction protein
MESVYLGREPIIDRDNSLFAYEVLYKNSKKEDEANSRYTSASVINTVLNKFGTNAIIGNRKAFVKVDEKFLMHDLIFTIPSEFFIYSLKDIEMSERVIERVEQLHQKGYELSLDDTPLKKEVLVKYQNILKKLSYIRVTLDDVGMTTVKLIEFLHKYSIKVVSVGIKSSNEYKVAKELGCDLFQGYFFAEPKILENSKYEPAQANILELYNLLLNDDTDIDVITQAFEDNHEITLQLLQFINSGAFHFRNRIASIHHILSLVGRIPLSQWLMLMIYSKSVSKTSGYSPLMLMVKNRTELMEKIVKVVRPNASKEFMGEAYFVGVLSLIDTVFGVELEKILNDMQISIEVKEALLEHKGILGEVYLLVRAIEVVDIDLMMNFEEKYSLESDVIENIVLESMQGVNEFENPSED